MKWEAIWTLAPSSLNFVVEFLIAVYKYGKAIVIRITNRQEGLPTGKEVNQKVALLCVF